MKVQRNLILLGFFLFLISFTFAAPPVTTVDNFPQGYLVTEAQQSYLKVGEDYRYHFMLSNSSDGEEINSSHATCKFFIQDLYGNILDGGEAEYIGEFWEYNISGDLIEDVSQYAYAVKCNNSYGGFLSGTFETTLSGLEPDLQTIFANIVFILFLSGLLFGIYQFKSHVNLDKYRDNILKKYEHNYFKRTFASIFYGIMSETFILVYLIVWLMITTLLDVAYSFSLVSLYSIFLVIVQIASVGFVLVGIVFLSRMAEILIKIKDDFENQGWGIE